MNAFESNFNKLWGDFLAIREKITNISDPNMTINTNSTIILRIDEQRKVQEIKVLIAEYENHIEAELRSLTLPILADDEIFFGNLHQ